MDACTQAKAAKLNAISILSATMHLLFWHSNYRWHSSCFTTHYNNNTKFIWFARHFISKERKWLEFIKITTVLHEYWRMIKICLTRSLSHLLPGETEITLFDSHHSDYLRWNSMQWSHLIINIDSLCTHSSYIWCIEKRYRKHIIKRISRKFPFLLHEISFFYRGATC
jgi:hypothetical protein